MIVVVQPCFLTINNWGATFGDCVLVTKTYVPPTMWIEAANLMICPSRWFKIMFIIRHRALCDTYQLKWICFINTHDFKNTSAGSSEHK